MCGIGYFHRISDSVEANRSGLSHRGQDSEGYATIRNGSINVARTKRNLLSTSGLVDVIDHQRNAPTLVSTRYRTTGINDPTQLILDSHPHVLDGYNEIQPDRCYTKGASIAMVHNGDVRIDNETFGINPAELRTTSDTEQLLHVYKKFGAEGVLRKVPHTYSAIVMESENDYVTAFRDQFGRRPLWVGTDSEGRYILASEDSTITGIGGDPIEPLTPGTIYRVHPTRGIEKEFIVPEFAKDCWFEPNYLESRSSTHNGVPIDKLREDLGRALFEEYGSEDFDFVSAIPNSPLDAARGYAEASGKRNVPLFVKDKPQRSFIEPNQRERLRVSWRNLNVVPFMDPNIVGHNYAAIEDSIVRGNTAGVVMAKGIERGFNMTDLYLYSPILLGQEDGVDLGCHHGIDMTPGSGSAAGKYGRNSEKIAAGIMNEFGETIKILEDDPEINIDPNVIERMRHATPPRLHFISIEKMFEVYQRNDLGLNINNTCLECIRS